MSGPADAVETEAMSLLALANEDPASALPRALKLVDEATYQGNDRVAAIAGRAAGLAEATVGSLGESVALLDRAVRAARRTQDRELQGEVEMTAGAVRCWAGDNRAGLRSLDRAVAMLTGVKRARALVQRGSVRYRAAQFEAALRDFDAAEPSLEAAHDDMWLAHLFTNRGLSLAYRGSLETAEADLARAEGIYSALGHRSSVAQMTHNRGWVAARLGEIPRALEKFDQAESEYNELHMKPAEIYRDRAEALVSVHLAGEAFASAMRAAQLLERDDHAAGHAEAMTAAAEAAMLDERYAEAETCAIAAEQEFIAQERSGWARYAEVIALRARGRQGGATGALWQRACDIADELESSGMDSGAMTARVLAADLALAVGDHRAARIELDRAADAKTRAPIDLRTEAWYVEARLRRAADDPRGAIRAVDAGLRVVEQHQAVQGATETRAHAAGHAKRLARMGVELAWDSGRSRHLLRWMERTRAGALRFPPVRIPDDAGLAGDLAELRHVEGELRRGDLDHASYSQLEHRRRKVEHQIQQRTRRASGGVEAFASFDPGAVLDELGDRALVEYGRVGDDVVAVTAVEGKVRRHAGPPVRDVTDAIDMMRFGLARLAAGRASAESIGAARAAVGEAAQSLSAMLLDMLPLGDRELVIVPPPALHALAWGLLPATAARPIVISPSAELWFRRRGMAQFTSPVVLAGPRLPHAPAEVAAVRDIYRDAVEFDEVTGTVGAMREALPASGLAHLACHGRFRADNPLFSALEMADGWFTVYDFENLAAVPELVVLSACDAGLSAERPGDEVMGIVAGLLGAGTRTVVASVGLVPDAASTRSVMEGFHRRLVAGDRPSVALASAQHVAVAAGDLASASFVCFGYS